MSERSKATNTPTWLSRNAVSRRLGVSRAQVDAWLADGTLRGHKVQFESGSFEWRISNADVERVFRARGAGGGE